MGYASRWYYSLDLNKTKVWNELVELFMDQLIFNTVIYVTFRDLEKTPIALPPKFKISDADNLMELEI